MANPKIKIYFDCDNCGGCGVVYNHAWDEIEFPVSELEAKDLGPEELPCDDCDGTGQRFMFIDLNEIDIPGWLKAALYRKTYFES